MHLGLIAGNGRFPFLVLEAARAAGHRVTIIALKEEAFPELEVEAAKAPVAALHRVSLGQLGTWLKILEKAQKELANLRASERVDQRQVDGIATFITQREQWLS